MNENYKGSIELISGLKQKNDLDFPLMEASAVAFYDPVLDESGLPTGETQEIRLTEKIKQVGISDADKKQLIEDAVAATIKSEDFATIETQVAENTANIETKTTGLLDRVSILEKDVQEGDNKELKLQFEQAESILYLYAGDKLIKPDPDNEEVISNIISQTGITGGGSGATLNYALGLSRVDQNSIVTFLHTDTPKIKFNASLVDTSVAEGEDNLVSKTLNFKLTVKLPSGAKNVYNFTGLSNTNLEYDLTNVLSATSGLILGDHDITLTASYTQDITTEEGEKPVTIQSTKSWTIRITQMYLISNFEDASAKTGDVPFSVTVYGDLDKTIHYNFGGQEGWKTLKAPLSNYGYSITIPKQSHGNYPLEVYLTADINGEIVKSNSLFFDIMWVESGNQAPVIRAVPASAKGQQYSNLAIAYSVYTPGSLISEVELAVDGKVVSTLDNVDRAEKVWNYKPSTEGIKVLTIKSGETVRTLTIEIEKLPYAIEPVTAGLELDFIPQGRTNEDADYNVFKNNAFDGEGNEIPITWTLSENFDWINGGWKVDENDDAYFCVKAGTSVDINYLLFNDPYTLVGANKSKGNGKEFKIVFKTSNVARPDTTWLSCLANPELGSEVGIQMDAHTAYVKSSSGALSIPYSEEDKIEFDVNIVPITYSKETGLIDLTIQDIPMIMTYEDGTPVRPLVLTSDSTTFKQQNAVPITIGSPYCDVHIYRMKAYSTYLSEKNILNNFIADAPNAEEMIDRYKRNQIYDAKTGKLTPESFAAACPNMRVIKLSAPRFTNDKKDKVLETEIEMIYKNGDTVLDNWKATNARHNGQGTSSNAYGYAGRNLELSLKEKETVRYKITKPEGVYNEDGELVVFGTILEGKQDFFLDEALEQKVEDASTIAEITTIPGTVITLGDGTTTKKVSLTRDSVPTNYFNVKVNIASSEHANNALLQKRYDRYLPYTSYAAARDDKIKNNMNFYNCVIFIQERNTDLTTHQEFNDNEWHFYSMGNIGDSKKTDDSRTSDPEDTTEFCVEIMDWNRELSAFPQDTKVQTSADKYLKKDKSGTITDYIFATEENLQAGLLFEKDYSLTQYQEQNSEGIWVSYGYKVSTDETLETGWIVTNKQGIYSDSGEHFTPGNVYEEKTLNQKFYTSADVETREEVIVGANTALRVGKYYIDILEQDDYSEDYTYGFRYLNDDESEEQIATAKAKWNEFYRFITRDNYYDDRRADSSGQWLEDPEKVKVWKKEFENWFIKDAAFYYYLFTLRYTMVDNRAKNSFWHWGKSTEDGKHKMDFWDYDNDTALGIDNTGKFTMSYGVEDHDVNAGGAAHFRAHNSTFFVRVADYFAEELISYYKDKLEENDPTVFSSTSLISEFDNWQSEFPEELWRVQYERIYKRTYVGGYGALWDNAVIPSQIGKAADPQFLTEMMNGKKKYQRRQFERNQDVYMSSKFFGKRNFNDVLTLRGGGDMDPSKFIVKPNGDITITPYLNMYVNTGVETNKFNHHIKVNAGESVTLPYPTSDLEFNYIWGASYLQSLGDLSPMYLRIAKLGQGQRLKQIIVGNPTSGYNNPNLSKVDITAGNKLLEELDVRNITLTADAETGAPADTVLPIEFIPSLRKLYAQGTNYTVAKFANSGLIEEAYLPRTIHTISATNLYYLHTLELEDASTLGQLLIDNCPKLKELNKDYIPKDLALVTAATNLGRVRLTNIDWRLTDATILNRLLECSGIGEDNYTEIDQSVLTGKVDVENLRASELRKFNEVWPKLEITYTTDIPEVEVTFKDIDGRTLGTTLVDQGGKCINPITSGLFDTPTQESTAQYDFTFAGWKKPGQTDEEMIENIATVTISEPTIFVAVYTRTIRTYKVEWFGATNNLLHQVMVEYGQGASYDTIPIKQPVHPIYSLFAGWDKGTGYITENTQVYPIWEQANGATIYNGITGGSLQAENLTPIEIYALSKYIANSDINPEKVFEGGEFIKVQLGYMPSYSDDPQKERLLASDLVLNGKNYLVFDDIKLFEQDIDYTIALDFTPSLVGTGSASILSCFSDRYTRGLKIFSDSGDNYPKAQYGPQGGIASINPSPLKTTELETHREICVIRHRKGQPGITLYRNDRYSLLNFDPIELKNPNANNTDEHYDYKDETKDLAQRPLIIGGDYSTSGVTNLSKGTVHYAKIWFSDIGDAECKKICSWTYNEINFDYAGYNRYYYSNADGKCQFSFISQDLLDELAMLYNSTSEIKTEGWKDTDLRTWMNTKLFGGVSILWRQILQPVSIKSIRNIKDGLGNGALREQTIASDNYFYLPSLGEVTGSNLNNVFLNELTSTSDGTYINFADETQAKQDRIKTSKGKPSVWWLRSPYYSNQDSSSTLQYFNFVAKDGSAANRIGLNVTEAEGNVWYSGVINSSKYGICPCFSI